MKNSIKIIATLLTISFFAGTVQAQSVSCKTSKKTTVRDHRASKKATVRDHRATKSTKALIKSNNRGTKYHPDSLYSTGTNAPIVNKTNKVNRRNHTVDYRTQRSSDIIIMNGRGTNTNKKTGRKSNIIDHRKGSARKNKTVDHRSKTTSITSPGNRAKNKMRDISDGSSNTILFGEK